MLFKKGTIFNLKKISTFIAGFYHVELWCGRHGLHPLERSPQASTGLPHLRVGAHGSHLHQVSSKLVSTLLS